MRLTLMLARTPVIKFRKGGQGSRPSVGPASAPSASSAPATSTAAASPTGACSLYAQRAATMSTSSIPDIDLPLRYRRAPLTQEEIDHINGGGIV